jgi:tripartite-type tricarboxylate transporter receptor subunit TctC
VPISAIERVQETLVVNPHVLDVSTLQQFLEAAKQKPESIDVASGGLGTVPHLAIEMLQSRTGIRLNHVPYRGGGPALQDLLGGQVAAMFGAAGLLAGYVRTGKLRAIATAGHRREPLLPDVPTMSEAGLANFHASSWDAVFAPRGTPEPALDRMHGAIQAALASDTVRRLWAEQGAKVDLESRADFSRFVAAEIVRWGKIVKAAKVRLE